MREGVISRQYNKMTGRRNSYVNRAIAAASVTIPSLFPPLGSKGHTDLRSPPQSTGAKAVNTLASKLLLALLPPNQPFARVTIDEADLGELSTETKGEVELTLVGIEHLAHREIEEAQFQPTLYEVIKQLLVAGNSLLFSGEDGFKQYRLDRYVIKRDGMGRPKTIIICEPIDQDDIPRHIRSAVVGASANPHSPGSTADDEEEHKLYTRIERHGNHWVVEQEIDGVLDPKARSTYPLDKCPYIPLRMIRVDGEDYGRSYVEEYIGDLKSLDVLSKALNEGTAAAARVLFLVRPNSTTKPSVLVEAPNGGFVHGQEQDVSVLQLEKQADFNTARQRMAEIKEDLSAAFLMNSSLTRSAERVTATEIRAMAQELETVLGGVYSLLSVELQLPLMLVVLGRLQRAGKLPTFPDNTLKPKVLTGVAALGRTQDLDKLRLLLELIAPLGEQVINENMEVDEYIARVTAALSIDAEGLIPTKAQKQARRDEQEAKELMQMLGPDVLAQQQQQQPV